MSEETLDELEEKKKRRRSRMIFLLLAVVFAIPYAGSIWLYNNVDKMDLGTTNYGEFIDPALSFGSLDLQSTGLGEEAYKPEKWLFLSTGKSDCGEPCKKNLYLMRQMRRALGVERAYVQKAFLLLDGENIETFKTNLEGYEKTIIYTPGPETVKVLASLTDNKEIENRMYLIDQNGNLIMAYNADAEPKGILKDVKKLFRVMHKE